MLVNLKSIFERSPYVGARQSVDAAYVMYKKLLSQMKSMIVVFDLKSFFSEKLLSFSTYWLRTLLKCIIKL